MRDVWRRLILGPGLFVAIAVLISGILIVQGVAVYRSYLATWALATRSAENVLQSLSANITQNLNVIELSLAGLQEAAASAGGVEALPQGVRYTLLFDRVGASHYLGSIVALDARGDIRFDSRSLEARAANLSDRDYFRALVAPREGTYVSVPFKGRLGSNRLSIALSRRISGPDGAFLGITAAALRITFFNTLFDEIQLGPDSSIRLVNTDGILIAVRPEAHGGDAVGADTSSSPLFQRMKQTPREPFVLTAPDGIQRFYLTARLEPFPLLLSVGISTAEVQREWMRQTLVAALLTLIACVFIVILFAALRSALAESQRMHEHMKNIAVTDSLTDMPNRRALDIAMSHEVRRSHRYGMPISVLMIDIDHFKVVNDVHGHSVGDEVLHRVGQLIMNKCRRAGDLAARYGGEEFTVLLPGTTWEGACVMAENIRIAIMQMVPSLMDPGLKQVTVSIGVASNVADTSLSADDLLKQADRALYVAKETGRNRVVFEPDGS